MADDTTARYLMSEAAESRLRATREELAARNAAHETEFWFMLPERDLRALAGGKVPAPLRRKCAAQLAFARATEPPDGG